MTCKLYKRAFPLDVALKLLKEPIEYMCNIGKLPVAIFTVASTHTLRWFNALDFMGQPFKRPDKIVCRSSRKEKRRKKHNAGNADESPLNKPLPALQGGRVLSQKEAASGIF